MAESKLDQIVKGASTNPIKAPATSHSPPQTPADPLSTLPSSPPQIYLNLLILEASLRSQYLTLRARRRQHTFFLFLLTAWLAFFFYALFLRPREDGRGVGGSVYWVVETAEKVALMGGVVTGILVWGTGQWERGVRWPRRWVGVANRGLRGINSKLVVIKGPWWSELFSTLSVIFPYSSFFRSQGSSYHYVSHLNELPKRPTSTQIRANPSISQPSNLAATYEEDLAPGGDYVKLLLLPKPFSPAFRENWEAFRSDYWENENERRAHLLLKLRQREREMAKLEGGWLWWTGWRGWKRAKSDVEKSSSHHHHGQHQHQPHHRTHLDMKTSRPSSMYRSGSHSRNSSRSTTPTHELDEKPTSDRRRRSSTTSNSSKTSTHHYDKDQPQQQQQQQPQSHQQQPPLQQRPSKRRSKTSGTTGSTTRSSRDSSSTSTSTRERSSNRGGGGGGGGGGGSERVSRLTPADSSRPTTPNDNVLAPSIRRESSMHSLSSGNESDRSAASSVLEEARSVVGRGSSSSSSAGIYRERGTKREIM